MKRHPLRRGKDLTTLERLERSSRRAMFVLIGGLVFFAMNIGWFFYYWTILRRC